MKPLLLVHTLMRLGSFGKRGLVPPGASKPMGVHR